MDAELCAGAYVRLKNDPGRSGTIRGPGQPIAGQPSWRIHWPDGRVTAVPADQIEPVPSAAERPIDLLRAARVTSPDALRRILAHTRLTGRLADMIYSIEATDTDFYAHQFKPVLKMLNAPNNALLIADEVGLGKTIEAGLIWTELTARYDLRRLLVVCPKTLCAKWQAELRGKFRVDARIVNAEELLETLRDDQRHRIGFALIASLPGLRPPRGWNRDLDDPEAPSPSPRHALARLLAERSEDASLIDLMVLDEAHHVRNRETLGHQLVSMLRAVSDHTLFLSATPVHLGNHDLHALLSILDAESFDAPARLAEVIGANAPLIALRDAILVNRLTGAEVSDRLREASGIPLLRGNEQIAALLEDLAAHPGTLSDERRANLAYRLEQANLLAHVITRTRRRDVEELRVVREVRALRASFSPMERHAYEAITAAIHDYAAALNANARFLLAERQRMLTSCLAGAIAKWRAADRDTNGEDGEDGPEPDDEIEIGPLVQHLGKACRDLPPTDELTAQDSKFTELCKAIDLIVAQHPHEKIVVFSSFRFTLEYLAERLRGLGHRLLVMHGASDRPRQEIITEFERASDIRLLLSSEVGSEGIDLQFCRLLVNYDLPWNPMRVEQRIGRIDRLGQAAEKVTVFNLLHHASVDEEVYDRLYRRLDECRRSLGEFEAILGPEVRQLTTDLMDGRLTDVERRNRIERTGLVLQQKAEVQRKLEQEAATLIAHGDVILQHVRRVQKLADWFGADEVRAYVIDALRYLFPGSRVNPTDQQGVWEITLSPAARDALGSFLEGRNLPPSVTRLVATETVRCRFERDPRARRSIEFVGQAHPLVRMLASQLNETEPARTRPAVAATIRASDLPDSEAISTGDYAVLAEHWEMGSRASPVEQLGYAGVCLRTGAPLTTSTAEVLALATVARGRFRELSADDAAQAADLLESAQPALNEAYAGADRERMAEVTDRAAVQRRTLEQHLRRQSEWLRDLIRRQQQDRRNPRIIRANEGKLARLQEKVAQRLRRIDDGIQPVRAREEIAAIHVRVVP